ncbi:MAG: neutral zinc metallopeptidase [Bacteroides sp.]|nr:neutral zinc metallopeptidase [Bacteroides sp.]MCM1414149.1 neutral zinc metallopeptidase [Bacteroides sp.]MCM1471015.1 neutral zinc metallopeptidase [Bacteroides sp.]
MRLDGRRRSTNVDDRRGGGGGRGTLVGGGIVGLIVAVIGMFFGGDIGSILSHLDGGFTDTSYTDSNYTPSAEEEELADFSKQILAGTEDVWTKIFEQNGLEYEPPRLVLFTGAVNSGCGNADASVGPFYCSADEAVYIDLSFFQNMRRDLGADGDFAYAYVIAHEVGHHVQHLLGTLEQTHQQMQNLPESAANRLSVALELQADFYAGVWAYHDNQIFGSLEPGDVEEALDAAQKIGDDYLQKKARGYAVPESFNHGTSQQRSYWLNRGLQTGDPSKGDTFSALGL